VIGVFEHAGWAHAVCVAERRGVPAVIARRRVTLIEAGLPTLPYHHDTIGMRENEANALLERVRTSIFTCATAELGRLVTDLAPMHATVALAIREPVFPELPRSVVDVWQSYRLQCAADGVMYQLAICRAARNLGLDVHACRRGQEAAHAAGELGVATGEIELFLADTGRPSGPPWTDEHRRIYAAGIAALAAHTPGRLRISAS
jgi:hypothetical protein